MTQINPNLFPKYLSGNGSISEEQIDCLSRDKECDNKDNAEDPYDLDIVVSSKNDTPSDPIGVGITKTCTCNSCHCSWTCPHICK
jgi:hypothetical protein